MKNMKNRKGFTLVELVVVILIIAILATATFLGGATIIKQARASKVQTNLNNFATYVQDMLYAEGSAPDTQADAMTAVNKYLTEDFKLNGTNAMKDSWEKAYVVDYAKVTTVENTNSHTCAYFIISSDGANGLGEAVGAAGAASDGEGNGAALAFLVADKDLVTEGTQGADFVSAEAALKGVTDGGVDLGDDLGVIIMLRDGAVSTAYYGF